MPSNFRKRVRLRRNTTTTATSAPARTGTTRKIGELREGVTCVVAKSEFVDVRDLVLEANVLLASAPSMVAVPAASCSAAAPPCAGSIELRASCGSGEDTRLSAVGVDCMADSE